ncbi:hypothetical protein ACIN5143_A2076 [Acinetobacter baumannii OIFC143]|nr:hypothetical protein ACIN5143_A2076 [Acinetobacter baumannii OIFC143]EXB17929.1 hypothetical protein J535_3094 [Acinetobacter baumannii 1429530]EXB29303.1 hypothetical protein J518_3377 [Acinetobacter baumannii 1419130]KCY21336.1 hypothetical protein J635_2804 [Acinetobacter baumannii 233846]
MKSEFLSEHLKSSEQFIKTKCLCYKNIQVINSVVHAS